MADDPLFGFTPTTGGDPLMGFKPALATGGQSAQPSQTWTDYLLQHLVGDPSSWNPNAPNKPLGQTAFWNKPSDVSWGDYAAAHLQPLDDTVRAAANTFGGDRFAAMMSNLTGVGGGDLAAQKAQSEARAKADPSATAQGNVVGALMPGGVLGEAAQGGRAIGEAAGLPWWLASPLAGGTVGGGATAGGESLRGEPLSPWDIALGTVAGGVVGALRGRQCCQPAPRRKAILIKRSRLINRSPISSMTPRARFIRRSTSRTPKTPRGIGAGKDGTTPPRPAMKSRPFSISRSFQATTFSNRRFICGTRSSTVRPRTPTIRPMQGITSINCSMCWRTARRKLACRRIFRLVSRRATMRPM